MGGGGIKPPAKGGRREAHETGQGGERKLQRAWMGEELLRSTKKVKLTAKPSSTIAKVQNSVVLTVRLFWK